ncbi:MAG: hypothetical protein KDA25_04990 [Phycisphaerales bacterium]|nr:hypothetical protein [Phycisphaerales bacterium]
MLGESVTSRTIDDGFYSLLAAALSQAIDDVPHADADDQVKKLLQQIPAMAKGLEVYKGPGGAILEVDRLAATLKEYARLHGAGAAASLLGKVQRMRAAEVLQIMPLAGEFSLRSGIDLGAGCALVPFDHLGRGGSGAIGFRQHLRELGTLLDPRGFGRFRAAIVCHRTLPTSERRWEKNIDPPMDVLEGLVPVLALCGPSPIWWVREWFEFVDPELDFVVPATSWRQPMPGVIPSPMRAAVPEGIRVDSFSPFRPIDGDIARAAVAAFRGLNASQGAKFWRSAARFLGSMQWHYPADAIMDLGLAFDILLAERTQRQRMRRIAEAAARSLGGKRDERLRTQQIVEAAYDMRSSVVHTGRIERAEYDIAGSKLSQRAVISAATTIFSRVALTRLGGGIGER